MAYDNTEYRTKIADAAARLEAAIRTSAGVPTRVFALYTTEQETGALIVARNPPPATPGGFTEVLPHAANRWEAVPYSHMYTRLYNACRSLPILSRA
jgi:hypothetical protein